jgi:D-sedoheptulose 7-phosphate isomerase
MKNWIEQALVDAASLIEWLRSQEKADGVLTTISRRIADTLSSGGRVLTCGNGGSMCDAMHFAEELSGRFRDDRPAYAATAISDPSHMSCVGNDYGYDQVFSRYVEAHGNAGDVLLAISTSGTSRNIVAAAKAAQACGMKVIALTGKPGAALESHADIVICTPGGRYADRVQELHIKVIHILIELVEHHLATPVAAD